MEYSVRWDCIQPRIHILNRSRSNTKFEWRLRQSQVGVSGDQTLNLLSARLSIGILVRIAATILPTKMNRFAVSAVVVLALVGACMGQAKVSLVVKSNRI